MEHTVESIGSSFEILRVADLMMARVPDISLGASDPIPNMAKKGKTRQLLDTSRYLTLFCINIC